MVTRTHAAKYNKYQATWWAVVDIHGTQKAMKATLCANWFG